MLRWIEFQFSITDESSQNIQQQIQVNSTRWNEFRYLGIWPVFKTIQIDIKSNHISYSNTIIFPSTTLEHKNWSWFISCFCFNQWIFSLLNIPILFRKKYNNGILLSVGFYPLKAINAYMLSACMLYCSRENQGYP